MSAHIATKVTGIDMMIIAIDTIVEMVAMAATVATVAAADPLCRPISVSPPH